MSEERSRWYSLMQRHLAKEWPIMKHLKIARKSILAATHEKYCSAKDGGNVYLHRRRAWCGSGILAKDCQ